MSKLVERIAVVILCAAAAGVVGIGTFTPSDLPCAYTVEYKVWGDKPSEGWWSRYNNSLSECTKSNGTEVYSTFREDIMTLVDYVRRDGSFCMPQTCETIKSCQKWFAFESEIRSQFYWENTGSESFEGRVLTYYVDSGGTKLYVDGDGHVAGMDGPSTTKRTFTYTYEARQSQFMVPKKNKGCEKSAPGVYTLLPTEDECPIVHDAASSLQASLAFFILAMVIALF